MYNHLLVQCHPCPIWLPVLPIYLTYIPLILSILFPKNLACTDSWYSKFKSHVQFSLLRSFQRVSSCPKPHVTFRNMQVNYGGELVASPPQLPSWRITPCRLSTTAYTLYSKLPSISGGLLLHPQPEDTPCRGDKGPT
jgi:hypothetical protein